MWIVAAVIGGCNESGDIRIMPTTAITRWTGEALDQDIAVEWLMQ
jgi:hypothetical protein